MWRNGIKCKYMFLFPLNNLARKGLIYDGLNWASYGIIYWQELLVSSVPLISLKIINFRAWISNYISIYIYIYIGYNYLIMSGLNLVTVGQHQLWHDDVIKWKHFPHYWPFVRGIHRSPVNSPHKGQWRGALMFSLICVWINGWVTFVRLVIWDAITPIMTSL